MEFFLLHQFHIKALSSLARLRLLNVRTCTPRSLNPRRLDIILDLELELYPAAHRFGDFLSSAFTRLF